jgi:hypothetical protein
VAGVDPAGLLHGRAVTPNVHAISEHYVSLENFSADGEVSGDTGHHPLFGSEVNNFIERESQQGFGLDQARRSVLKMAPTLAMTSAGRQAHISSTMRSRTAPVSAMTESSILRTSPRWELR